MIILDMEVAMNVKPHHTSSQLLKIYKTQSNHRLSRRVHGVYWSNRTYTDYDDLRFAAIEAWQKAALDPEIIKSVCRAKYAKRNY